MNENKKICCGLMTRCQGLGRVPAERFVDRMTAEEQTAMAALQDTPNLGNALTALLDRIADRQELDATAKPSVAMAEKTKPKSGRSMAKTSRPRPPNV